MSTPITIAYVLTSDGRDQFADMALVSMLSVRISNPGCRIVLLCDSESALAIKNSKHRVLDVCDEMVSIDTPTGNPTFRNRWIKTQLCLFCPYDAIYLDADTLVRDHIGEIPQLARDFAAVPNHNQSRLDHQIEDVENEYIRAMSWSRSFENFYNGGVWFYRHGKSAIHFFQLWHTLWCEGQKRTLQFRDQPSLNVAISESGIHTSCLPNEYNCQMFKDWSGFGARIWHFYSSASLEGSIFSDLLSAVDKSNSLQKNQLHVRRSLESKHAWKNKDLIADLILSKQKQGLANHEILWLQKKRLAACRLFAGKLRECFLN